MCLVNGRKKLMPKGCLTGHWHWRLQGEQRRSEGDIQVTPIAYILTGLEGLAQQVSSCNTHVPPPHLSVTVGRISPP